jgi:hypothetical protein
MNSSRTRRAGIVAAIVAVAATIAFAAPSAATAATDGTGWLRLGHFSPDTKAVDVRVTAVSGGSIMLELSDVAYGDISSYQSLKEGTYTISMIAADSDDWTKVAISDTVTVAPSEATTVAAYGPSATLQLRAFSDDLTTPASGNARIRVIQASTITPTVNVKTSTGLSIASNARPGSATAYAEVPAGSWNLQLVGAGVTDTADVTVAAGSVNTLFVLDTADGGLTILPILDSAATPVTPVGGVQTGGGWFASHAPATVTARSGTLPIPR